MSRRFPIIGAVVLTLAAPRGASGQTATDLLSAGVQAYQDLDYAAAAAALRHGLLGTPGDTLSTRQRLEALTYLAATEVFRGRRDSAAATFRRLVVFDPAYQPSELIFPPRVTDLFREVRDATKAVALDAPAGQFPARLLASSPHEVTVAVTAVDGQLVRTLYDGPITDSLALRWDGFTGTGMLPEDGRYLLRVTSRTARGAVARVLQAPLEVRRLPADTPSPSPSPSPPAVQASHPLPRQRTLADPAVRALAGGLVAAAAVVALPRLVSRNAEASGARFAVAATIGVSGLVGFLALRPGRPLNAGGGQNPPGVGDRRSAAAKAPRLMIRVGRPVVLEREPP